MTIIDANPNDVTGCDRCGQPIVWVKSHRTGNNYPVNAVEDRFGNHNYVRNDFHPRDCAPAKPQEDAPLDVLTDDTGAVVTQNGTYTITGEGQRTTFRVRTQRPDARFAPGKRVLGILSGPDNTSEYTGVGFLVHEDGVERIAVWRSKQGTAWEDKAELFAQVVLRNEAVDFYTILMAGSCCVCNRKLTVPESIISGIGPVCAAKS